MPNTLVATHPTSAERILSTALDLFAVKGYDATAVREICEAAGITKPTLYHFYGSKEGVLQALVKSGFERFAELGAEARIEAEPAHGTYWWPLGIGAQVLVASLSLWYVRKQRRSGEAEQ